MHIKSARISGRLLFEELLFEVEFVASLLLEDLKDSLQNLFVIDANIGGLVVFIGILVFTMLERMISFFSSVFEELMRRI